MSTILLGTPKSKKTLQQVKKKFEGDRTKLLQQAQKIVQSRRQEILNNVQQCKLILNKLENNSIKELEDNYKEYINNIENKYQKQKLNSLDNDLKNLEKNAMKIKGNFKSAIMNATWNNKLDEIEGKFETDIQNISKKYHVCLCETDWFTKLLIVFV